MQRIKTVRWPTRNIGGDRAFTKLRYVKGQNFYIPAGAYADTQNLCFNVGASGGSLPTITSVFGSTPGLSILGAQYLHYRIKGIALKITYWATATATPIMLFTNAQSNTGLNGESQQVPSPDFIAPNVSTMPEQRWARYKVCGATNNGARPTTLKTYYSVNKVFGPDAVVKNDEEFTGQMLATTPYFSTNGDESARPQRGPWLQYGLTTLSGQANTVANGIQGTMKIEATVYAEFFGKRPQTQ